MRVVLFSLICVQLLCFPTAYSCLFFPNSSLAGECYTWTDVHGQVHITTSPPPHGASNVTVRRFEGRSKSTTPSQPPALRRVAVPSPSRQDRVTTIDPMSIKLERERLQAEIIRLQREKQKSTSDLGISKHDRNGYEKMRSHRKRCDRKISDLGRRMGELRRDPVRYAHKYKMILY